MDMLPATDPVSREDVLEAMAQVMDRQARVVRAEAALASARRRLSESVTHLSHVHRARGESLDLPPLAGLVLDALEAATVGEHAAGGEGDDERAGTLRQRIVAVMERCTLPSQRRLDPLPTPECVPGRERLAQKGHDTLAVPPDEWGLS